MKTAAIFATAVLTQETVQRFLWCAVPLKWASPPGESAEVVDGLARLFELLSLPRYAAICRSAATKKVLAAYARDEASGIDAFDRAEVASGIRPPDLPELEWGSIMGVEEARAQSSTADFLELAVAGRDLVPGARGWTLRQQELVRAHLTTPRIERGGETLANAILTERVGNWLDRDRSDVRRRLLGDLANRLLHPVSLPAENAGNPLPQVQWLLDELRMASPSHRMAT